MRLLSAQIAARVLGVTPTTEDLDGIEFGGSTCTWLEYAARTRAVELYPVRTAPTIEDMTAVLNEVEAMTTQRAASLGAAANNPHGAVMAELDHLREIVGRSPQECGGEDWWTVFREDWTGEDDIDEDGEEDHIPMYATKEWALLDPERAAKDRIDRALAGEPHDGGSDGCPPAAVRHIVAGALVASLVTGMGFPYGDPPWLPLGAGPIRQGSPENDDPCEEPIPEEATQATRGRYGVAECVCQFLLGMSTTRDPEGPTNDQTPDEIHERAVDLAIDMLADESHSVAEIAAGAAAWLLVRFARENQMWAVARARRICSVVGIRFPREEVARGA